MPSVTPSWHDGPMDVRRTVLDEVAGLLAPRRPGRPLLVGVDGVVGSGKSTFARELVNVLQGTGRPALHLDSDGFHHVRAVRQSGSDQARGYYDHAYDLEAVADRVLRPLGAGASLEVATRVHDLETDEVVDDETTVVDPAAVVVFDCTFLQRDDLRDLWDEVVWLDVRRTTALRRGVARDAERLGGVAAAEAAYETRYMAACDLYVAEQHPRERASIVVDHEDPTNPRILRPSM